MLHPRLTPVGATIGGSSSVWLAQIGPIGYWADLAYTTRWGDGACGMFEASWTMALPAGFTSPYLRRGVIVELMDGAIRVGSPLIMSEPAVGAGFEDPWQITCTGIGREVEGENSFIAFDGSLNATTNPQTAVDQAITRGWRIGGRDASVTSTSPASLSTSENLNTAGALLLAAASAASKRWTVKQDNLLYFVSDPTTPTWQTTPGVASLGVADDDYASAIYGRYLDSTTGTYLTRSATNSQAATQYGVREYPVDFTDRGAVSSTTAQAWTDGVLALLKGRLGWTNGLTLTSNELLNMGGVPASLSMVEAGQMLRIHGIFDDLLAYSGETWLDIVIGETKYTDGDQTIQINPLGLAARDLAAIIEQVAGPAVAA